MELMCVLAIMSVLASMSWPSIVGILSGDRLTNNAYELSGLIQQARTTAMTQHTYVWLGFYSYTQNGAPALMVASLAENSGLATVVPTTSSLPNSNFQLAGKPVILNNVSIATVSNYTNPALPGLDVPDNTDVGSQTYSFSMSVLGIANATFNNVIAFGPDGQTYLPTTTGALGSNPVLCVGVGLTASPGSAKNLHTAAVQVHGLSGQVSVFQQ